MLISQKIEKVKLSSGQKAVTDYLHDQGSKIKNQTIKEVAEASYTSTGTIMRLIKKLDFQGFNEFKEAFIKELNYLESHFNHIDPNYPFNQNDNIQKIASKITILAKETLNDTLSLIEHDSLQKAVLLLHKAKNIHLAAISYSLLLGQIFQLDMLRIGVNVNVCHINGEELFSTAIINQGDCLLVVSYSGSIDNLVQIAKKAREKQASVIVITSLGDNRLVDYADVILRVSTREKLYSKIGGFSNEYSIKLILDILYSCYYALDYQKNSNRRINISKEAEINRQATLEIMKEETES